MTNANPYARLRSCFADRLDRLFLVEPDGTVTTYGDIDVRSARFAGALLAMGVQPGDRVATQLEKSVDAVALYLACLRVGGVYLPLNEAYTLPEITYFTDDATPVVYVGRDGHAAPGGPKAATLASLLELDAPPFDGIVERAPNDMIAMLYTSGTTGRSKGAMLTCANLTTNALALHELWGFSSADVLLHALPVFHVHGLFVALHCAMLSAAEVRFLPRFDVSVVRAQLRECTVMMGVPTFYARLLADSKFGPEDCSTIRLFIAGSAPLTEAAFRAFDERTGHTILERYGMTETGMITSNPLDGDRVAGTVGFALPDVSIRVADEHGAVLEAGSVGVVEVRGPNVFRGYWGMPDKTAAAFRPDGWFITGDVGVLDPSGRLSLVGRESDLIIAGGYNVYPKEIELLIDEVPGVAESAVVGLPHPDMGEGVAAFVVLTPGAEVDGDVIRAALDGRLARFKQPRAVFVVDDLPRNAMGKVQKAMLRAAHAETFTQTD